MKHIPPPRLARYIVGASAMVLFLACTVATPFYDEQGKPAWIIQCGAATSLAVCHKRALKECPAGYTTLSERGGFNRREIRVRCHPAPAEEHHPLESDVPPKGR